MDFNKKALLAAVLAGTTLAARPEPDQRRWNFKLGMEEFETQWFDNRVDHFNDVHDQTYRQRYWMTDKYADLSTQPPAFLYVCGEWTCSPPDETMYPMMVGEREGALLYSLEHRYYGESQPFDDWSTENLRFLRSEQALADINQFIKAQNKSLGYDADWIVVGGSYPGALVAWFKSQYPDTALGAWSSSGVIHAIRDFKTFDLDIFMRTDNSSPECSDDIKRAVKIVENQLKTEEGTARVAEAFNITIPINRHDFMFFFADIFVMGVQYGTRKSMCADL